MNELHSLFCTFNKLLLSTIVEIILTPTSAITWSAIHLVLLFINWTRQRTCFNTSYVSVYCTTQIYVIYPIIARIFAKADYIHLPFYADIFLHLKYFISKLTTRHSTIGIIGVKTTINDTPIRLVIINHVNDGTNHIDAITATMIFLKLIFLC